MLFWKKKKKSDEIKKPECNFQAWKEGLSQETRQLIEKLPRSSQVEIFLSCYGDAVSRFVAENPKSYKDMTISSVGSQTQVGPSYARRMAEYYILNRSNDTPGPGEGGECNGPGGHGGFGGPSGFGPHW